MDENWNLDVQAIRKEANADTRYQQLFSYYQETEDQYNRLRAELSPEEERIIEDYLTASEAMYYRFAQLAYRCGTAALNKTAKRSR